MEYGGGGVVIKLKMRGEGYDYIENIGGGGLITLGGVVFNIAL